MSPWEWAGFSAAYLAGAFAVATIAGMLDPHEDPFLLGVYGLLWPIVVPVYLLGALARFVGRRR